MSNYGRYIDEERIFHKIIYLILRRVCKDRSISDEATHWNVISDSPIDPCRASQFKAMHGGLERSDLKGPTLGVSVSWTRFHLMQRYDNGDDGQTSG